MIAAALKAARSVPLLGFLFALVAGVSRAQESGPVGPEPVYPDVEIHLRGMEEEGNPVIGAGTTLEHRRRLPPRILSDDELQSLYERQMKMTESHGIDFASIGVRPGDAHGDSDQELPTRRLVAPGDAKKDDFNVTPALGVIAIFGLGFVLWVRWLGR